MVILNFRPSARIFSCWFLSVCLLLLASTESVSQARQTKGNGGVTSTSSQSTVPAVVQEKIPLEFRRMFFGTIDGKDAIQMDLTRSGNELHGSYVRYVREAPGKAEHSIRLVFARGSIDQAGDVTAKLDTWPQEIGSFQGKLYNEVIGGRKLLRLAGEQSWFSPLSRCPVVSLTLTDLYDLGNNFSLVSARKYKESKKHNYSVDIIYPQIEPAQGRFAEEFNRKILSDMNKKFLDYIRYQEKFPLEDSNTAEQERTRYGPSFFDVHWELVRASSDSISILFRAQSYGSGAVHPIGSVAAFNYDRQTAKQISLWDLFRRDSDFLRAISNYCIANLAARVIGDEKLRSEGAGPKLANYRAWVVVPEGIRIHFSDYQVASYAEGEQIVVVPLSVFKDLLKPESRRFFQSQVN